MTRRLIAAIFYYGVAQHLPASYSPILGRLWSRVRATLLGQMAPMIGQRVDISRRVDVGLAGTLTIGQDSGLGDGVEIHGPVSIGQNVMISPGVLIHTRNHATADVSRPMKFQGYAEVRPVTIHDDVWVGARAIILPGVIIGRGAVVGAGAVVAKDVPEYSIVVGNPARIVRMRV